MRYVKSRSPLPPGPPGEGARSAGEGDPTKCSIQPSPGLRPPSPGGRGRAPCTCHRNCEPQQPFSTFFRFIHTFVDCTLRSLFGPGVANAPDAIAGIVRYEQGAITGDCQAG